MLIDGREQSAMFEKYHEPVLSRKEFASRQFKHFIISAAIVASSLLIGIFGYHITEGMSWIDSFVNASMILGGMGPVDALHSSEGKLFAGCYALFSGVVFLLGAAVLFAPAIHRFLHLFHLDEKDQDN